ncbi:MAG: BREX system Lon protease-like protein BrxL [Kosmotogaceae bacterium]
MKNLDEKIRRTFPSESVYHSTAYYNIFSGVNIPSFIKDYLIQRYTDGDGRLDKEGLLEFIGRHIPQKKSQIQKKMISEKRRFRLLTRLIIEPDIKAGVLRFEIPEMGIKKSNTLIPEYLTTEYPELTSDEVWGVVDLALIESESGGNRIELCDFTPFKPYETDLSYFQSRRSEYSIEEWINLLIRSMEYNPEGFESLNQKLLFISRLLVFVEPNLNLIELAPKGTGKSYVFSNLSKYGWIISGGVVTRAKLFYDIGRKTPGLIMRYDFIAMDEAQTIKFSSPHEVAAGLKTYLESGKFTVANYSDSSHASFILLGNIKLDQHKNPTTNKYFSHLPGIFNESALLDRFHGFIEGWKLPRIREDLIVKGYALNVEYFSEILHSLRTESKYRIFIDELLDVPRNADTRDTKAIKRISTGYLKLLFPHVNSANDIPVRHFELYCLRPALRMRGIIRNQIHYIDEEYNPEIPNITIK